jgi:hypothetical protein
MSDLGAELLLAVGAAPREELRELVRAFDAARDAALLRLLQPAPERWLTVSEAAEVAQAPERRIRKWSRRDGVTWASRPTRKGLRIHEERFRAWLERNPRARDRRPPEVGRGGAGRVRIDAKASRQGAATEPDEVDSRRFAPPRRLRAAGS